MGLALVSPSFRDFMWEWAPADPDHLSGSISTGAEVDLVMWVPLRSLYIILLYLLKILRIKCVISPLRKMLKQGVVLAGGDHTAAVLLMNEDLLYL